MWYLGHPWPLYKNFTEIVAGEPLRWGVKPKRGSQINIAILDFLKAISRKRCKIGGKMSNRKSHMSFRLVGYQTRWPWMTLNGVISSLTAAYNFIEFGSFRSKLRKNSWRYTYTFCSGNVGQRIGRYIIYGDIGRGSPLARALKCGTLSRCEPTELPRVR